MAVFILLMQRFPGVPSVQTVSPKKSTAANFIKGEQFIRCMADGEIVARRVCRDYESAAIEWRGEKLFASTSFVLVKHYIQPLITQKVD